MKVYEINDQCNRWENMNLHLMCSLIEIFEANYPDLEVRIKALGIFGVRIPIIQTPPLPLYFITKQLDVSIVYTAFVQDPDIPSSLKEESLKFLLGLIGPPV